MRVRVTVVFSLAIFMFLAGIGGFALIYAKGQDLLPSTIVYEPIGDIKVERYTEITSEKFDSLFEAKEILQASVTPNMITAENRDSVMDKVMVQTLYPGDFLTVNYVGESVFTQKAGEKEYPIPASWWEVLDWTGRNGDIGEIWLFPTDKLKQALLQTNVSSTTSPSETGSGMDGSINVQVSGSVETIKETPERPLSTPILTDVRLRYITDSANKAIHNGSGVDDRSEGSGKPTEAKIFLTPEQYGVLKMAVQEGYKLIYAVNEGE
ncbi:hypothetical protein [Cohnella sp. AR92]|uniref:hypothetical protein n=1 Tax=Cohnella sp. AR92 TaxID=648716 RepID=UPI000F8F41B7|nr:hypothetical protein [Cohnella sp. AR92]RUS44947.1 hypothetical protein ELR57_22080 [Cohnella sp. AR92]